MKYRILVDYGSEGMHWHKLYDPEFEKDVISEFDTVDEAVKEAINGYSGLNAFYIVTAIDWVAVEKQPVFNILIERPTASEVVKLNKGKKK